MTKWADSHNALIAAGAASAPSRTEKKRTRKESDVAAAKASFDRNLEAYVRALPALLKGSAGMFALVGSAKLAGVHESREEAMNEGYRRFGLTGFLVQEISREELEMGQRWLKACQS